MSVCLLLATWYIVLWLDLHVLASYSSKARLVDPKHAHAINEITYVSMNWPSILE
jgi:hypothetical protein